MKKHKLLLFKRISKQFTKATAGCPSATCPFKLDNPEDIGTAQVCTCGETARGIATQLDKELTAVGL